MPATSQTITHYQGNAGTIRITVTDEDGLAVNLSGFAIKWWMGKSVKATGTDVYVKKTDDSGGGIALDVTTDENIIVITLDNADTATVAPGSNYYHETQVVDGSGNVVTVATGKFILVDTLIPDP